MSATRNLAELIESYLEDDGSGSDATNGSSTTTRVTQDSGARAQVQQLTQKVAQLQQDMDSIKNNLQMSAILPLLINQKLKVVSDSSPHLFVNEEIEFSQADPVSALLPALLLGGMGDSSNGGSGNNSSNMLLLALALSGNL